MQKPNNYEKVQASGDYTPITLGGHILVIKEVLEMKSKTNKDMLKISFDMSKEDKQAGYFADSFKNDIRPDKKWPAAGVTYILAEDEDGNCSRQLKTFVTAIEKSNSNFQVAWGDGFAQCLKEKKVGGVFGMVEEEYNGAVHNNHKLRWFRSIEKIEDVEVPKPKYMQNKPSITPQPDKDGFVNVPAGIDEELPFS